MTSPAAGPTGALVGACAAAAVVAMIAGAYFGATGQLALAMTATALFVLLGGLAFDFARRRSNQGHR